MGIVKTMQLPQPPGSAYNVLTEGLGVLQCLLAIADQISMSNAACDINAKLNLPVGLCMPLLSTQAVGSVVVHHMRTNGVTCSMCPWDQQSEPKGV